MPEMPADPNGQLVMRFMAGTAEGNFDDIDDLVHDDFVMEWPQSGERFSGRDNACAAMKSQQDQPEMAGVPRLVGGGDTWVMMVPLRYSDGLYHYTAVLELANGRIKRATGTWATPFPAQAYRAEFADRV